MRRFTLPLVPAAAAAAAYPPTAGPAATPAEAAVRAPPARVEPTAGSGVGRIALTERAARRLEVQTEEVRRDASGEEVVPHASILRGAAGAAWVHTSPAPLTLVRHPVAVARVNGSGAHLKEDGPPVGTRVVTAGAAQLCGAEKRIGH